MPDIFAVIADGTRRDILSLLLEQREAAQFVHQDAQLELVKKGFVLVRGRMVVGHGVAALDTSILRAQAAHQDPVADAEQPGAQPGAIAQAVDSTQYADPDVLGGVVRRRIVAGQVTRIAP